MNNEEFNHICSSILGLCAGIPKDIAATYVSSNEYSGMSFENLENKMHGLSRRVATLTGQLGNQVAKYASLKGKYEAVDTKFYRSKFKNYTNVNKAI